MVPAWRDASTGLRLLRGLTVWLLLLLCPRAAWSDCSFPPDIPNAQPDLEGRTSFPEGSTVMYSCNEDFVKVPGKTGTITCLKNNEWWLVEEFCNRSCHVPTLLLFAVLKQPYRTQNYFPAGTVVEYECRKGYNRNHSLSGEATCLQNYTWSKPNEFCTRKSCPNPGELINGYVNITTDILFGASIIFSCNTGYKLVGETSSYCIVMGKTVGWSDPLPECKEISQTSTATPTPQKPTTVNTVDTKALTTHQKPTTVNIPATQSPAVTTRTTPFHLRTTSVHPRTISAGVTTIAFGLVAGTIIIAGTIIVAGTLILVKIFWDCGKSGSYYTREDTNALNAIFHNLTVTPDASEIRPSGKL